ncbi:hypothetical protein KDA00_01440 [Candidatus Saccharibacteria bacterium]|nr:hypothetical protein [Candidatus Saccharibacteria bacterium]
MAHPDQLCEVCVLEQFLPAVNPIEHARRGVRLISSLTLSIVDVQEDFDDQQQKEAIQSCAKINVLNSCPNLFTITRNHRG